MGYGRHASLIGDEFESTGVSVGAGAEEGEEPADVVVGGVAGTWGDDGEGCGGDEYGGVVVGEERDEPDDGAGYVEGGEVEEGTREDGDGEGEAGGVGVGVAEKCGPFAGEAACKAARTCLVPA